jgi:hypothetical protein
MVIQRIDRVANPTRPRNTNQPISPAPIDDTPPPPYPTGRILQNVFVKDANRTYTFQDVPQNSTVEDFFRRLQSEKQLPPDSIRVIFGGKELNKGPKMTLGDYNVQNQSTLHIVVSYIGGWAGFA